MIRVGQITAIFEDEGRVQVTYPDTGNVTKKIPMITAAWLAKEPEIGDTVLVEHLSTGSSSGIVIGPYVQTAVAGDVFALKDEAITSISRSGLTFTATMADGSTFTFDQQDNDTWNANSKNVAGYVAAPGAVSKKVWKTDADGNPAWRDETVTDENYVHTDNNFTNTLKNKLDGIAEGAEVNQNAFGNVKVGSTTIVADAKTDTLTLVAGDNVTLTPDATNDKVTIAATDTVYTHPPYTARTGKPTANQTPSFGSTFTVSQITSDATGHVTGATDRTVKIPNTEASDSAAGLMSASDKGKLDGIDAGANAYTLPLAANGTRGGVQIGYSESGKNYAVKLSNEKMYVNVPWTDNDTKNTAGSTDSSSKLFLVGATSQAANPQTYSHDTAYVGTNGHLYSNSKQVVNLSDSQALTNKTYEGYTLGSVCALSYTVVSTF